MIDLSIFLNIKAVAQILILWGVIYHIFLFLQGTRAAHLLWGVVYLTAAFFAFQKLDFLVLNWVMTKFFAFFLIIMAIVFQPELREGLIRLGRRQLFTAAYEKEEFEKDLKDIVVAAGKLARRKIGALIAIKREISLKNYIESGVFLNAELSSELLQNIFYPLAPLHDGGVIIEGNKVLAASCLFPLSESNVFEKTTGMRHRAGVGLSEHSDALVVIVSEENGSISLAINGQLTRDLTPNDLLTILKGQLSTT